MKRSLFYFIIFISVFNNSVATQEIKDKTIIKSNKIDKDRNNVIRAIGDVEMKKGDKIFNANEVEYDQNNKIIKANSSVKAYDEKTDNIFFSKSAKISNDFKNGDFQNSILLFRNGSNITSDYLVKDNNIIYTKNGGEYSVCPTDFYDKNITYEELVEKLKNTETKLFSLKSSKIKVDTDEEVLKLYGTSVWFWKVPIFYIPYFKTSSAFGEATNGFGLPGFESTSHYGYGFYIPYKFKINGQKFRLTPKIYQKGNYLANLKFTTGSKEKNKWKFTFNGDIANDANKSENLTNEYGLTEKESGDYKRIRGFASINGFYNFNPLWIFDVNSAIASDRYYFRDYYGDNLAYIQSNFRFSRIDMQNITNFNYFDFSNLFYQELMEENYTEQAPRYAPVSNLNIQNTIFKNDYSNTYYKLKLNTTNLFRTVGIEYNRFTFTPSFNSTLKTKFGILNTNLNFKSEVYLLNENHINRPEKYKDTESRLIPELNIEWRKTLASKYFTFQPIVKYSGSPHSQSFEKKIPNEDSKTQILDFENIFSNNRYIGYDRNEYGNRISYGFEAMISDKLMFGLAQGYRDDIDKNLDKHIVGFEKNLSDYVGYSSIVFNDTFDITYKFLANKDNFKLEKSELLLNFNFNNISLYSGYIEMEPNILYYKKQKQTNSGISISFLEKWTFYINGIVDLENDNRFLETMTGLVYDGGCTRWELRYKTTNPLTETEKNSSLNFDIRIRFD